MKRLAIPVLASSLVACAVPIEDYPDEYAKVVCARLQDCEANDFKNSYGEDVEACREDMSNIAQVQLDFMDAFNEEYDQDAATECIREMKRIDCADIAYDCDVSL